MKKTFEVMHNGHQIQVVNSWFGGEKLYIDGQLQDENLGLALRARLWGELKNGDERQCVKVSMGGIFKVHCTIFVDNSAVYPVKN